MATMQHDTIESRGSPAEERAERVARVPLDPPDERVHTAPIVGRVVREAPEAGARVRGRVMHEVGRPGARVIGRVVRETSEPGTEAFGCVVREAPEALAA